jgi:hypothetical protein
MVPEEAAIELGLLFLTCGLTFNSYARRTPILWIHRLASLRR